MKIRRIAQATIFLGAAVILIRPTAPAAAEPWRRYWSPGFFREIGEVEKTEKDGKESFVKVGHWSYRYSNGKIKRDGNFTRGIKTGPWRSWHKNGVLKEEGVYNARGEKVGTWEYRYESGLPRMEGAWRDGLKDGSWIYWYERKNRKEKEGGYKNGLKDGPWIYWYENGRKKKEGRYVKDLESGPWTFWYQDGQRICAGNYLAGVEKGEWSYRESYGEKLLEWSYDYVEATPSTRKREVGRPSRALVGHWIARKEFSVSRRSQFLPPNPHHVYFRPDGKFIEILDGKLINRKYFVEDEDPGKRTILVRLEGDEGRGAILFGVFSRDYRRLAGRYYLVDFLRGSRGKLTNYFSAVYAGNEPGPEAPSGRKP